MDEQTREKLWLDGYAAACQALLEQYGFFPQAFAESMDALVGSNGKVTIQAELGIKAERARHWKPREPEVEPEVDAKPVKKNGKQAEKLPPVVEGVLKG